LNEVEIVVKSIDKTNFKPAKDAPKDIEKGMGHLKSTLLGLGVGSLLVGEFKGATDAAQDSNRIGRETEARLKSTGATAWTTASAIAGLAAAQAEKVGVDDDLIQGGENMLLTFKGVTNAAGAGNDIFNRATKSALDLAAGMHHGKIDADGLQGANIMLGKALEDPVKGITALTRVGVTFTAKQKEQIKGLVEHGDKLGAQKVILKAVGDQFAGTAEASATAEGKMSAKVGNLQEKIGNMLLPVLDKAATLLGKLADFISRNTGVIGPLIGVVATVIGLWKAWSIAQGILNAVMAANPIGLIIIAIAALVVGVILAYKHSKTFRDIVQKVWEALKTAIKWVTGLGRAIKDVFLNAITWLVSAGKNVIMGFWNGLKAVWQGATGVIGWWGNLELFILRKIGDAAKWLYQKGRDVITGFWNGLKAVWQGAKGVISWFAGLPSKILHALGIKSPPAWAIDAGHHIMMGLLKGLTHGAPDLRAYFRNLASNLFPTGAIAGAVAAGALGKGGLSPAEAWIIAHESGGNVYADNPNSTAFGLGQLLEANRRRIGDLLGYAYDTVNYAEQLAMFRYYVAERYGTAEAAKAFWEAHGWYEAGTDYVPRTGPAFLHKGEAVIPAGENRRGRGPIVLEIRSGGSRLDDLLVEVLRNAVRVRGGNVQLVLGR
jgi:hypothetical protein